MGQVWIIWISKDSEDLKSDFTRSGNIQNPDFLQIRFQLVQFFKGSGAAGYYEQVAL